MKTKNYAQVKLPDGNKIFCLNRHEVQVIYQEVESYLKNGIELRAGDTVFDVGANIGLFTLLVNHLCDGCVNVYAFEPIPAIFDVLHVNIMGLTSKNIKGFAYGLSNQSKTTTFAYYPRATIVSQIYPGFSKEERNQLRNKMLDNLQELPLSVRWLRWLPSFLRPIILDKMLTIGFQVKQVSCQLKTLSEVIHEHQIKQIDLLKIDVEKSEFDLLLGIAKHDWQKIKQIVVEVHNFESRLEKITDLLKQNGFNKIVIEQEPILKGSDMSIVYAFQH